MYKHLEKERVEEELPSFSMLVMKCSAASPYLSIVLSMKEESWVSCGNCDYLAPWDLSSLSTKSSPMLSMMLGVKEKMDHLAILEVLPSCVWISSSMCLHLCCLNFLQLLLVLSHGPNNCFISSSPPSIPRCPIAASSSQIFSFNFHKKNMYWNIDPLRSARLFLSNESSFVQN